MSRPRRERRNVVAVESVGPYVLVRVARGGLDPGTPGQAVHARSARPGPAAADVAVPRPARGARFSAPSHRPRHMRARGARALANRSTSSVPPDGATGSTLTGRCSWAADRNRTVAHLQRHSSNTPTRHKHNMHCLEALFRTSARAQAEAERARRLVDSNIIGVFFARGEAVTDANDAYLDLVGYSRDDLAAGRVRWRKVESPGSPGGERALRPRREGAHPQGRTEVPVLLGVAPLGSLAGRVGLLRPRPDRARPDPRRPARRPDAGRGGGEPRQGRVPRTSSRTSSAPPCTPCSAGSPS